MNRGPVDTPSSSTAAAAAAALHSGAYQSQTDTLQINASAPVAPAAVDEDDTLQTYPSTFTTTI